MLRVFWLSLIVSLTLSAMMSIWMWHREATQLEDMAREYAARVRKLEATCRHLGFRWIPERLECVNPRHLKGDLET